MISITQYLEEQSDDEYLEEGKGLRLKTRLKAGKRKLKRVMRSRKQKNEKEYEKFVKEIAMKIGRNVVQPDNIRIPLKRIERIGK